MAPHAWLGGVLATQLLTTPIPNSRPLDADAPRAVPAPLEREAAPAPPNRGETAPSTSNAPPTTSDLGPDRPPSSQGTGCLAARGRCRTLTLAGIGTGAGGALIVGAGITGIVLGQPLIPDQPTKLRDYQSPGIALTTIGSAAVLTGVTLFVVGRVAHRRSAR